MERGGSSCAENALRATSSYWHDETLDPGCAIREEINEMVKILNDFGSKTKWKHLINLKCGDLGSSEGNYIKALITNLRSLNSRGVSYILQPNLNF